MKLLLLLLSSFWLHTDNGWLTSFDEAKQLSKEKNIPILLNFSGSDWCGPCIRMKKEIFESATFMDFAANRLILLNADFPRRKKNQLSDFQLKQNEALAEKYNPLGKFPLTLLLDADGKLLKEWDGFPDGNAGEFVQQISKVRHGEK